MDKKIALTIAGSDSIAGAGIQADLKTFYALGVYGTSALTAVTAQNTCGVNNAHFLPEDFVAEQIDAVATDVKVSAVKTGMLANDKIVKAVAHKVKEYELPFLVVDPVLVSTSGHLLLTEEAVNVIKNELFPLAKIVTPNIPEAEKLTDIKIETKKDMEKAAILLREMGPETVLIKGGHKEGEALDIFFDGKEFSYLSAPRIGVGSVHGTGCTLSAAIASYLAREVNIFQAVEKSKKYVWKAINENYLLGKGSLLLNH
ncbi:hydroxymethylpyrimidine/phosphomethylpyrimidine kinase [Desulfitispora alkaliphila]|uniref:bifunctional hydroxymethylpyrimidine kinase/phosphomethylpyrimidine kinase n=1 Tax=Desulfitispora alkaliphila TaxID=622674 RepID=UPI003D192169